MEIAEEMKEAAHVASGKVTDAVVAALKQGLIDSGLEDRNQRVATAVLALPHAIFRYAMEEENLTPKERIQVVMSAHEHVQYHIEKALAGAFLGATGLKDQDEAEEDESRG